MQRPKRDESSLFDLTDKIDRATEMIYLPTDFYGFGLVKAADIDALTIEASFLINKVLLDAFSPHFGQLAVIFLVGHDAQKQLKI